MKFSIKNDIAHICIDNGKANAADLNFVDDMSAFLDKAIEAAKAVIIYGRSGMFSAGFDLKAVERDPTIAKSLEPKGMALLTKLYAHPQPVIAACDGHAIGLGAFLLLVADLRLGSVADYNISLPETAMGWGFPPVLMTLIKHRIAASHQTAAVLHSRPYSPEEALSAGFLDEIIERDSLMDECQARAEQLSQLPSKAYSATKEDLRSEALQAMRKFIAQQQ